MRNASMLDDDDDMMNDECMKEKGATGEVE